MSESYTSYLSEVGQGKRNVVVEKVVNFVTKRLNDDKLAELKIADFGCFNGAMLSAIYSQLSHEQKTRVNLYGFDNDQVVLSQGKIRYPFITFTNHDFINPYSIKYNFDVIILSNVLHEIYSLFLPNNVLSTTFVKSAFVNIVNQIKSGGTLYFLDGIMPNAHLRKVVVQFEDMNMISNLEKINSTFIQRLSYLRLDTKLIEMTWYSLAIFLTKVRYIEKDFWGSESRQIYQYFTFNQFYALFKSCDLQIIERVELPTQFQADVKIIKPKNQVLPSKSILLVARKN